METGAVVRIAVVFAIIIGCLACAEILLKVGSDGTVSRLGASGRAWATAGGFFLMVVQQMLVLLLFHWRVDASVVVPVCGLNFALVAILGKVFLGEPVDLQRWLGIFAITLGAALVAHSQKGH